MWHIETDGMVETRIKFKIRRFNGEFNDFVYFVETMQWDGEVERERHAIIIVYIEFIKHQRTYQLIVCQHKNTFQLFSFPLLTCQKAFEYNARTIIKTNTTRHRDEINYIVI